MRILSVFSNRSKSAIKALFLFLLLFSPLAEAQYKFNGKCAYVFDSSGERTDYKGSRFSSPEQVAQLEARFAKRAKDDLNLELEAGHLDTNTMVKGFLESGARDNYTFGTFRDLGDVFAAQMIRQSKVKKAADNGKFYTEIYGEKALLSFKKLRNRVEEIPNNQFYFSRENLDTIHQIYGKDMMVATSRIAATLKAIGFGFIADRIWQGGGNPRLMRTRFYAKDMTYEEAMMPLKAFEILTEPGMPFAKVPEEMKKDFQIRAEHPYAFGNGVLNKLLGGGIKKQANGLYSVMYSYPPPRILDAAIEAFIAWGNTNLDLMRAKSPEAIDPIEFAAITQYSLVAIHYYKDGNGRKDKIARDKILDIAGLPFDLRYADSLGTDLQRSLGDFVAEVRFGVFYALNRLAAIDTKYAKGANSNVSPSSVDTKIGLNLGGFDTKTFSKQERMLISEKAMPKSHDQVFELGGGNAHVNGRFDRKHFVGKSILGESREISVLYRGSFIQGPKGLNYIYSPKENTLYPIADWTTPLYGQGGELFIKKTRKSQYIFRRPNSHFQEVIDNNLRLFRGLTEFRKNPSSPRAIDPRTVIVRPYESISKPQESGSRYGSIYIQEFQKDLISSMFEGRVEPEKYPVATLARYRGNQKHVGDSGPTVIQQLFNSNKPEKIKVNHVAAAYSLQRQFLIKLEQDMKLMDREMQDTAAPLIRQSREDIYIASKTMMAKFTNLLKEMFDSKPGKSNHPLLSGSETKLAFHKWARKHDLWKGLRKYAENQEWFYDTFAEGIRRVDQDSTVVIRNIAEGFHLKLLGLATEGQQAMVVKLIPGLPSLFKAVNAEIKAANREKRKINSANIEMRVGRWFTKWFVNDFKPNGDAKNDGKESSRIKTRAFIDKVVEGVLADYYSTRGMDVEFGRPFIDLYLHTVGFHPQVMKSTSVDPLYEWMLNGMGLMKFVPVGADGVSFLYKVKVNKESAVALFSSYRAQSETTEHTWMHPLKLNGFFGIGGRKVIKVSDKGLRLYEVTEEGKPKRDENKDIVYTENGKITMDLLSTLINLPSGHSMVPVNTPMFNQRYQPINQEGQRIDAEGNVIGR